MAFKKNIVVGVSVNPEVGLEVAQIDYATRTVLKYGVKQLAYDNMRRDIADIDVFRETLKDLFEELGIPKGSEVVVNIPAAEFKVTDYAASLSEPEVMTAIEEELVQHPIFQNNDPCISAVALPNSTIQFTKVAYTVAQKITLTELAIIIIEELGCKLLSIDTSVNSTLNALIYNDRVSASGDVSWVLLLIENNCCRILSMQGVNYVDAFEERYSIGEVLGDEENYSIVEAAVNPIIKNLPSQCLYVVSKTNLISAKILSDKLIYGSQIIHQEANNFATSPYLPVGPEVDEQMANFISLDVIGAAIKRDFGANSSANFNLFNNSLGDIYTDQQPLELRFGSLNLVLSIENMIKVAIGLIILFSVIIGVALSTYNGQIKAKENEIAGIKKQINEINSLLEQYSYISTDRFNEEDEIKIGLESNKGIYNYYSIIGTEIPRKLWLTHIDFGQYITIEGQADNLESVYSFFRNIKEYNPQSKIKLQKLSLASNSNLMVLTEEEAFDTDSIITSMNADFYEFRISNAPELPKKKSKAEKKEGLTGLPDLED